MNGYLRHPNWTDTGSSSNVVSLDSLTETTKRVLVADAPDWHVTGSSTYANGFYGFASWSQGSPTRHGHSANYLFADLHAGALPFDKAHRFLFDPANAGN
jgi:prepilin-type processing-associated H-X9-DG protein